MVTVAALLLMTAFAPGVVRESAARVASGGPTPIESGDEAPVSQPSAPDSESAAAASRVFRDESPRFSLRSQGDTSLVAAVILRLKDEDAEVRRTAANALGRMQNRRAIDPLVAALEDESEEVRHAALEALSNFENGVPAAPIRRLLASPDNEMRAYAVNILGEMKDRASIPAITQLTTDAQEEVRHQALHALERMDAPIEESVIARVLEDREPDLRQQGASIAGDRRMTSLVPRLIVMLDDASGEVREQAAHALTEMKTDASHRALRLAITHRDAKVRRIAVAYLGDQEDK